VLNVLKDYKNEKCNANKTDKENDDNEDEDIVIIDDKMNIHMKDIN